MKLACQNCSHEQINSNYKCNFCGTLVPDEVVTRFLNLTFLLEEAAKPDWQASLHKEKTIELLRPYEISRHEIGLELGFTKVSRFATLKYRYLAVLELLDAAREKEIYSQLYKFLLTEQALLQAEYKHLKVPVPSSSTVLPDYEELTRRSIYQQCLDLLKKANLKSGIQTASLYDYYEVKKSEADAEIARAKAAATKPTQSETVQATPPDSKVVLLDSVRQHLQAGAEAVFAPPPSMSLAVSTPAPLGHKPLTGWESGPTPTPLNPPDNFAKPLPLEPRHKFEWSNLWGALLSDTILRTLLYIGAFFVVLGAGLFSTLNWNQFPALIQLSMLLGIDLTFFAASILTIKKLQLERAGITFLAISAAIFPFVIYGYTRPEVLNFDPKGTWTWISLLTLPLYTLLAWLVRDRIFSYMASVALFSAWCSLFYQFGLAPEWIMPIGVVVAVLLVLLDQTLQDSDKLAELAGGPFWVAQATVLASAFGFFGFFLRENLNGRIITESGQWALGAHFWVVTLFYVWSAARSSSEKITYRYGVTLMAALAFFLTLQKIPVAAGWHPLVFSVLGLSFLAWQSAGDLVSHLNFDANRQSWHISEVFAVRKPFSNSGWLLILASLFLPQASLCWPFTLAVLAVATGAGSLLYGWRWLGIASVLAGNVAFGLLLNEIRPTANWSGWLLAIPAILNFAAWVALRRQPLCEGFTRSLETLGHLWTFLLLGLLATYGYYIHDWLLIVTIYLGLAAAYKNRLPADAALLTFSYWLTMRWQGDTELKLVAAGAVLALLGFSLTWTTQKTRAKVYGLPFQQWGYGLSVAGVVGASLVLQSTIQIVLKKQYQASKGIFYDYGWQPGTPPIKIPTLTGNMDFVIVAGIFMGLAAFSGLAAYHRKLYFWEQLLAGFGFSEGYKRHIAGSIWGWLALLLAPVCVWQFIGSANLDLTVASLSVAYFAAFVGLAKFGKPETRPFGFYSYPALAGWLGLSGWALYLFNNNHAYLQSLVFSLVFAGLAVFAANFFKAPKFHWLVVNLLPWAGWQLYQLSGLELYWQPLFLAALALGLLAVGENLHGPARRSYTWTAHQQAAGAVLVSLLMYVTTFVLDNTVIIQISLSALLLLTLPYVALSLLRKQPTYVYPLAFIVTMAIVIWGKSARNMLNWPISETITICYLGVATCAAILHRPARPIFDQTTALWKKPLFPPQNVFSQMTNFWGILALGFSWQSPYLPAVVLGYLAALYLGRSFYEQRTIWLGVAIPLTVGTLWQLSLQLGWSAAEKGLYFSGLAAVLTLTGLLFKRYEGRPFVGWHLLYGAGLVVGAGGLYFASTDRTALLVCAAGLAVVFTVVAAFDRIEWSYLAAANLLTVYSVGYTLLGLPSSYFGLALFGPLLASYFFGQYLVDGHGYVYRWLAFMGLLVGLYFSWQNGWVMVGHCLILALVTAAWTRLAQRHNSLWLAACILFTTLAGSMLISQTLGDGPYIWLASLGLAAFHTLWLIYFAASAKWLPEAERPKAIRLLAAASQFLSVGLIFWSGVIYLTSQGSLIRYAEFGLPIVFVLQLIIFFVTRNVGFLYSTIVFGMLTYQYLNFSITELCCSNLVKAIPAWLLVGLVLLPIGVWLGRKGDNLNGLMTLFKQKSAATPRSRLYELLVGFNLLTLILFIVLNNPIQLLPGYLQAGVPVVLIVLGLKKFRHSYSYPFYLATAFNFATAFYFAANQEFGLKLFVGSTIILALALANLSEQNKPLAWLTAALAGFGVVYLALRLPVFNAVLALAIGALTFTVLGYGLERWKTRLLARPLRVAGNVLAGCAPIAWLVGGGSFGFKRLDSFSFICLFVGISWLISGVIEKRRTGRANWRFLSYAGVAAIEVWFSSRLLLDNIGQWQFYILPIGLLILYFGWQERKLGSHFALTLESFGLLLLLGTTLLQAFGMQAAGVDKTFYGLWLVIESLVALGFGAANRLRYYFGASLLGLLGAATALTLDPLRATDKWLLVGVTGLLLITVALVLERKRDAVKTVSKDWYYRLKQWE